ncbi:MAG: DUF5060 domain-containing protein [Planctomycetota bacterium]
MVSSHNQHRWIGCSAAAYCLLMTSPAWAQTVGGSATQYQTLTIDWTGPNANETGGATPNPFTDYRLDVEFNGPDGQIMVVPGYYAVDNLGALDSWRVNFTAPAAGQWTYTPRFYEGTDIAVAAANTLGTPNATQINGQGGTVNVAAFDPSAPGFLAKGTLNYTGSHYLQFANGDYYIKGGADSPENFLGYEGFDNTVKGSGGKGILHPYTAHISDWNPGDPDWDDDDADLVANDGRGIIGAVNYLHNLGEAGYTGPAKVNSVYFLPMNTGGDGQDTHPWASTTIDQSGNANNDNTRYDLSKLDQWEQVFAHTQEKGIMLHFVLNEAENPNKQELDDATLGNERKLFYREMIARFGHHQAVTWNVSEEYNLQNAFGNNDAAEAATVEPFADWIKSLDPYAHPVTVHNAGNPNPGGGPTAGSWQYFIGDDSWDITSLQLFNNFKTVGEAVEAFRLATDNAGRPIPIMIDEPESVEDITFDEVRKEMMWDILLSGGNVEWYTRSQDQSLDDFRDLKQVYEETYFARRLLEEKTPFWEMNPGDSLLTGEDGFAGDLDPGEVFFKQGEAYVLYLPDTDNQATGSLDLTAETDDFQLRWYDPTTGAFIGNIALLNGGTLADLPDTPGNNGSGDNDWAALVVPDFITGDLNGDGVLDNLDLLPFVLAISDPNGYDTAFPSLIADFRGDFNGDNVIDSLDIQGLVNALTASGSPLTEEQIALLAQVPEPTTGAALLGGLLIFLRHR